MPWKVLMTGLVTNWSLFIQLFQAKMRENAIKDSLYASFRFRAILWHFLEAVMTGKRNYGYQAKRLLTQQIVHVVAPADAGTYAMTDGDGVVRILRAGETVVILPPPLAGKLVCVIARPGLNDKTIVTANADEKIFNYTGEGAGTFWVSTDPQTVPFISDGVDWFQVGYGGELF
jgi:hypothetical protein